MLTAAVNWSEVNAIAYPLFRDLVARLSRDSVSAPERAPDPDG